MKQKPAALILCCLLAPILAVAAPEKPNVLVFYIDDMAYAQPGCYGGTLAPTPNIDRIAREGVRFTDGYVSACVCSPSRVGLLTGRYQARTGHDANSEGKGAEAKGLALTETIFPQRMKAAGYATGIVGKWHVGATSPELMPASRGFDEAFGTTGNLGEPEGSFYRGNERIPDPEGAPITSPIYAREACAFIEKHRGEPWFLYLPFNAVHSPVVASEPVLERFGPRRAYAAMVSEMDDAIGAVMGKLRDLGLAENTLVFCLSDNGFASGSGETGGLRGGKWFVWEGGIRVSWLAQWPARIPGGRVLSEPVIQLDILPTALAAAGVEPDPGWQLDGVNLLPLLEGKTDHLAPRELYWRFGTQYAIRKGAWKLVKPGRDEPVFLIDLASDPGEQKDLAAQHPEKASDLQALWDRWNATMEPPRWEDPRWHDGGVAHRAARDKNRAAEKKKPGGEKDKP